MMKNIDALVQGATETKEFTSLPASTFDKEQLCAKICDELKFSEEGSSYEAKYQRALCAEAIKRHFGVYS